MRRAFQRPLEGRKLKYVSGNNAPELNRNVERQAFLKTAATENGSPILKIFYFYLFLQIFSRRLTVAVKCESAHQDHAGWRIWLKIDILGPSGEEKILNPAGTRLAILGGLEIWKSKPAAPSPAAYRKLQFCARARGRCVLPDSDQLRRSQNMYITSYIIV